MPNPYSLNSPLTFAVSYIKITPVQKGRRCRVDGTRLGEELWTTHLEYMRVLDAIVERRAIRGENGVLLYLYHVNRPMYPGELTEKLGLTTGRIANILKELERERLILRTPDVLDKRRVRVALTPEGEALARRRNTEAIGFHSRLLKHMEPDEARRCVALKRRIAALIDGELAGEP